MSHVTASTDDALGAVVARFNLAIRSLDWVAMRACCTDDSIIDSLTAGAPLGPDETVAAVKAAYQDGVYSVSVWTHETLDPNTVLSSGRVRYRPGPGRMSDAGHYWLTTGKNGLMWRVKVFSRREAALAHLAAHGPTLGLTSTARAAV